MDEAPGTTGSGGPGGRRLGKQGRARRLLKGVGYGLAFAVPVTALAFVVREKVAAVLDLDEAAIVAATSITRENPWLRSLLIGWQEVTQPKWLYIVATGVCLVVWRRHRLATRAGWAFVTMMVAWNLQLVLKEVVRRARPIVVDPVSTAPGYSFPSGHAANAAAASAVVVLLLWPLLERRGRAVALAAAAVLTVGTALDRVFLGVHYPSDVVAGVLFGVGLAVASYAGYRGWNPMAPDDPPITDSSRTVANPRDPRHPKGSP